MKYSCSGGRFCCGTVSPPRPPPPAHLGDVVVLGVRCPGVRVPGPGADVLRPRAAGAGDLLVPRPAPGPNNTGIRIVQIEALGIYSSQFICDIFAVCTD